MVTIDWCYMEVVLYSVMLRLMRNGGCVDVQFR